MPKKNPDKDKLTLYIHIIMNIMSFFFLQNMILNITKTSSNAQSIYYIFHSEKKSLSDLLKPTRILPRPG